jgi:hypothetical protein
MKVFYFTSSEYAFKNIEFSRIKISKFDNLNDPFELLGIELKNNDVRDALTKEKSLISKNLGLICFSEDWQNPVQWGHYANNHKGICLGFEVDNGRLHKVDYVKSRLSTETFYNSDKQQRLLTTKFSHWSYEKEHRVIIDLQPATLNSRQLYFEKFSESIVLKEVIIGCESSVTQNEVVDICKAGNQKVKVYNARAAFRDFKIVWDRAKKSTRT